MPVLDLSPQIGYRRARPIGASTEVLGKVLSVGRWPGTALPPVQVLGSVVVPVVSFTGASARVAAGQGPLLHMETLEAWELMAAPGTPPSPLRIVGFISTAPGWSRAIEQVRSLAGLGAGMVLSRSRATALPLLDADATGVWVVGIPPCEPEPALWVTGRVGPATTAVRTPATRVIEEGLFAHALEQGLVPSLR